MSLTAHIAAVRPSVEATLEAADGGTLGLVGPNGAGKSTVLACLAGLVNDAVTRITLDGVEIADVTPAERSVGLVFQDLRLFPHMSSLDNVAFPLRSRGVPRAQARGRAGALLERLAIAHRASARPRTLSGGEAQRVALARALIAAPRLLLLDEPLAGLDVAAREAIRTLLAEILAAYDGVAVVVSHDPVDVMTLADELVIIEHGRVSQRGTPDEIRRAPRGPFASELAGVNLLRGSLRPIEPGVAVLRSGDRELFVAVAEPFEPVDDALVTLRPGDVAIHTARPAGSPRNVIQARIASVTQGPDRARIILDTQPPLAAELTLGSLRTLGLAEGRAVFASFKASELSIVSA